MSKRNRDDRYRLPDPAVRPPRGGRHRLRGVRRPAPRPRHPALPPLHARHREPHRCATCATSSSPGRTATLEVTAFLACWSYEEHWHGDAIAQVLRAHDEPAGATRLAQSRGQLPRRDALRPVAVHPRLGAHSPSRGRPHDLGCGQRVDHPDRVRAPRRQGQAPRAVASSCAGSCARRAGTSTSTRCRPSAGLAESADRAAHHPIRPPPLLGAGRHRRDAPTRGASSSRSTSSATTRGMAAAQRIDRQVDRLPGLEGLHLLEGAAVRALASA